MRERLVAVLVGVVFVVVSLFGIPRAYFLAHQVQDDAQASVDRSASLVAVAVDALEIRWEPSRGGALFPHLYGPLLLSAVRAVYALQLDESGRHRFPVGLLPEG